MIKTFKNLTKITQNLCLPLYTTNNKLSFNKSNNIIALCLLVLTLAVSSSAATFTVNTANDGNDNNAGNGTCASGIPPFTVCTLRAAVQEANALAGDDTINFAPSLANQTITLSSLLASDIDIHSNITIDATGVTGISVASNNVLNLTSRIFEISNSTVTMNNFNITGGRLLLAVLGGGGGIFSNNSTVTLNNMKVQDNGVLVTGDGGGIYVLGGTFNVNNSLVDSNFVTVSTTGGGGIFATGGATVNVNNSTITNNTALLDGGGILNTGGSTLNLIESTVSGNFSLGLGGGVANRAVALVITRANIRRSLISGNTPLLGIVGTLGGGALSNVGTDVISDAVMTVINSTITGNSSTAVGGGISNTLGDTVLVNNTISQNNSTVGGGGVVNVAGVLGLGRVFLRNNIVARNSDVLGTNLIGTDVLGIFNSQGNNLIGSNFGAEVSFDASAFVGITPQPNVNADVVGNVVIGNQIIDPLLGPLQDNGGPTRTRAITALSPAFNKGNNCVFFNTCVNPLNNTPLDLTSDQRAAGYSRMSGVSVDVGAYEVQLGPTAAAVQVAGRVFDGKRGVARAVVYLNDLDGSVRTTMTNQFGYYRFDDVKPGQSYIFEIKSKQFTFSPQVMYLTGEMLDLNFSPVNYGLQGAEITGSSFDGKKF